MAESRSLGTGIALKAPLGTAFIYSGNGSQWQGMGQQLLTNEPLFLKTIQEIDALFRRHADFSLEDELAGKNGQGRYEIYGNCPTRIVCVFRSESPRCSGIGDLSRWLWQATVWVKLQQPGHLVP